MPHPLFRKRLISRIKAAVADARDATHIEHKYLAGKIRETVVHNLFQPLLPGDFDLGTGKLIDCRGLQSPETDLIIYSRRLIPPLMFSRDFGVFPIESCFAAIEIKTKLTAKELRLSVANARRVSDLRQLPGFRGADGHFLKAVVQGPHKALFAFTSGTKVDEFARYQECDPQWDTDPAVDTWCVVGKGTWSVRSRPRRDLEGNLGTGKCVWVHHPPTASRDEAVFFLATLLNSLQEHLAKRGHPYLGPYFAADTPLEEIP